MQKALQRSFEHKNALATTSPLQNIKEIVRELVRKSDLSIQYGATKEIEADILSIPVERLKLKGTLERISIEPIEEER